MMKFSTLVMTSEVEGSYVRSAKPIPEVST